MLLSPRRPLVALVLLQGLDQEQVIQKLAVQHDRFSAGGIAQSRGRRLVVRRARD
jgi:hypothetical protein